MATNSNGWGKNEDAAGKDTAGASPVSPFFGLLESQSLMSFNNNIIELKDIKKQIEEVLKSQRSTVTHEANRQAIPKMMDMSTEQSPHLPGIILYTVRDAEVYLMPVLFYKKGATDALETLNLGNGNTPSTYNKFAESFVTEDMRDKVKSAFSVFEGKTMRAVRITASYVIDLDQYLNAAKDLELAVSNVGNAVLREWYTAMFNFTLMAIAYTDAGKMPNPFREGKLLGKDDTAVARIDVPQHPLLLDGKPSPANLMVKLATAPKGNIYSQNFNNVKSVATTYLNVALEVMSPDMYRRAMGNNQNGLTKGPLVPVISLGKTIPGEQFQNNDSILNAILGIHIMLSANNPVFFTEAIRQRQVGARGSLVNLAQVAYQVSGRIPPNNEMLTAKSLLDQALVMRFMQNYISPKAVFALDIPTFIESPANSEFWWNLLTAKEGTESTYYKAFFMMMDKLSNGGMSNYIKANVNNNETWKPGKPILVQSPVIIPTGTAVRDGQIFSLEEADQMLLRDPVYYGDNEQAISTLMGLINGACGKDLRVRQYEIKKMLEGLFGGNVDVTGWKSRWVFQDNFLNAFAAAMIGAGNVTVTSNSATQAWESQISNDYLTQVSSAAINNGMGNGAMMGATTSNW